jgi:hypothetical protein
MSLFQLDTASIIQRIKAEGATVSVPSIWESISRGIVGCILMSVAGFAPWALAGLWLAETIGEAGLYAVCAVVFIGLSAPLLHRLIIGRGSFSRFYKVFSIAFSAYAVAWSLAWMCLRGTKGGLIGLFAGTALMAFCLAYAFAAWRSLLRIFAVLFVSNTIGYFAGEWVAGALAATSTHPTVDKLVWGVCYGFGLGAGLGLAFYYCQSLVRDTLRHN